MLNLKQSTILLFLLTITTVSLAQAPDTSWTTTYDSGSNDNAFTVIQTSDDNYIVGGRTWTSDDSQYDALLIKLDESGDTVWTNSFGGSQFEIIYSLVEASDGGYMATGMWGSVTDARRALIVKYDDNGDTVWTFKYPESVHAIGYCIKNTSDDGYIITGQQYVPGNYWNVFLLKLTQDGTIMWSETYGGSEEDDGYCVEQTADGGYIACGRTLSYGAGSTDLYMIKTDAAGSLEWYKTFGTSLSDEARAVSQTSDGGYLLAGFIDNPNHGYYAVKTDSLGDTLWTRIYTHESDIDVCTSMEICSDEGFIFGGYTHVGGQHHDFYFVKANSDGDSLWATTIGFIDYDRGRCVKQTSDGGYILVGEAVIPESNGADCYIVKLDDDHVGIDDELVSLPENSSLRQNYPNPFNANTLIEFQLPYEQHVSLSVYDILGREIITLLDKTCQAGSHSIVFNADEIPSGVYFYRITTDDYTETGQMSLIK